MKQNVIFQLCQLCQFSICIFCVFMPFLSLWWTVLQPYRISQINALCINLSYTTNEICSIFFWKLVELENDIFLVFGIGFFKKKKCFVFPQWKSACELSFITDWGRWMEIKSNWKPPFFMFWLNLRAKLNCFICKKKSDFLTPLGPLGACPYRFEKNSV